MKQLQVQLKVSFIPRVERLPHDETLEESLSCGLLDCPRIDLEFMELPSLEYPFQTSILVPLTDLPHLQTQILFVCLFIFRVFGIDLQREFPLH